MLRGRSRTKNRFDRNNYQFSALSEILSIVFQPVRQRLFESFVRPIQRVPFLYILSLSSQPESLVSLSAFLLRGVDRRRASVRLSVCSWVRTPLVPSTFRLSTHNEVLVAFRIVVVHYAPEEQGWKGREGVEFGFLRSLRYLESLQSFGASER